MLKSIDLDVAAVEIDVGDKFHGDVERLSFEVGVNDEAQLQLLRTDRAVATNPKPRGPGLAEICRQTPNEMRARAPIKDLLTEKVSQLAWSASWPIANMPGWFPA